MKYTILINQKAAIDAGLSLDLVDLCVFSFISDFIASGHAKKKISNEEVYYLISWKLISKQLPILGLGTRQSVYNRIKKLCDQGVLYPHEDNQVLGQSWFMQGENMYKLLFAEPVNDDIQGCKQEPSPPVNNGIHNNTIIDNTISNKNTGPGSPAAYPFLEKKEITIQQRKITFLKLVIDYAVENPSKYPKLFYVEFAKYWVESSMHKKKLKLRFECQEFFDIGRRLSTWSQKVNDVTLHGYWDNETKVDTLNALFKKQILNINDTTKGQ
jgi:hypothetical protein